MEIKTKLSDLKALLLLAGKKDVRFYLNGIHFDFNKYEPVMVATDGVKLGAIVVTEFDGEAPDFKGVTIDRLQIENFARMLKGDWDVTIVFNATSATFKAVNGCEYEAHYLNANYPQWRRVVSPLADYTTSGEVYPVQFDPLVFEGVTKAYKLLRDSRAKIDLVIHHPVNPSGKALITISSRPDFLGVMMGARVDHFGLESVNKTLTEL